MAKEELGKEYRVKTGNPLEINPVYAARVETMGTNVCRILNKLDSLGLT
ncbi:MAG: hypothetical protein AAFX53_19275 [Bacteroidota bacterium]